MNPITNETQEQLEIELKAEIFKIGQIIFNQPSTDGYSVLGHDIHKFNKKLNEYFDNTRLLQTTIKGNVTL